MIRSNPIGLPEPSQKRDGYAVGRDGSFYRSSEHLASGQSSRAGSEARDAPPANWRADRRRSSGIRLGGGEWFKSTI